MERLFDVSSISTIGGSYTEVMSCRKGWRRYMERSRLSIGPYSSPFRAVDILDHFVLNVSEYMTAVLIFLSADICSYIDEECISLPGLLATN